jgi:hypothetical protein
MTRTFPRKVRRRRAYKRRICMSKHNKLDDDALRETVETYKKCDRKIKNTAKELGITRSAVRGRLRTAVKRGFLETDEAMPSELRDQISRDFSEDKAVVTTKSLNIQTVEQALEAADVDPEFWQVERFQINSWEVTVGARNSGGPRPETFTNWQVKVWLKPKVVEPLETAIRELIREIPKFKPRKVKPAKRKAPDTPYALEVCMYDVHFGKMAWGKETGQGDYDLKIAEKWFMQAMEKNLWHASPYKLSKIIYILGQDLMHAENFMHMTPLGHNNLDVDSRLPKIYKTAKAATLKALYMCREVAPVEVLWIPGNHDMHASFFLSEVIKEHFKNDKFVEVDNTPPWRKARLWGNLLVGYTHDASKRQANVVNMLPQFWPELWGKSKFREWHVGHKHKKDEVKYQPTATVGGVVIRQIATLSTIDAWHYQEGFVDAVPAGESFLWTKDCGVCGHFTANVFGEK